MIQIVPVYSFQFYQNQNGPHFVYFENKGDWISDELERKFKFLEPLFEEVPILKFKWKLFSKTYPMEEKLGCHRIMIIEKNKSQENHFNLTLESIRELLDNTQQRRLEIYSKMDEEEKELSVNDYLGKWFTNGRHITQHFGNITPKLEVPDSPLITGNLIIENQLTKRLKLQKSVPDISRFDNITYAKFSNPSKGIIEHSTPIFNKLARRNPKNPKKDLPKTKSGFVKIPNPQKTTTFKNLKTCKCGSNEKTFQSKALVKIPLNALVYEDYGFVHSSPDFRNTKTISIPSSDGSCKNLAKNKISSNSENDYPKKVTAINSYIPASTKIVSQKRNLKRKPNNTDMGQKKENYMLKRLKK